MKLRYLQLPALALLLGLLAGCSTTPSGVAAVAPAPDDTLTGTAAQGGQYTVYRAEGFEHDYHPDAIERVWTVSVSQGEQLGFRWETKENERWSPQGGFHLIAFAGKQTHDLGVYTRRDVKYLWATSNGDVMGYFQDKANIATAKTLTLQ